MNKAQPTYMTVYQAGDWSDNEQTYLGVIDWSDAVKTAKSQDSATRLCNSKGYNNQGYYFQPELQIV